MTGSGFDSRFGGVPRWRLEPYRLLFPLAVVLAWAGVGAFLVAKHRDPENRFAFLIKSLEVFIVGGLFAIAGVLWWFARTPGRSGPSRLGRGWSRSGHGRGWSGIVRC